ncbi:MAG: menaquinone biosynthesis protein [Bacillota bacterium]|nr:menaquinone biosynthesis protein [Bacillota bacterium]
MAFIRLGRVDYLNCLPVYYPLERGWVPIDATLTGGVPTGLNRLFLEGKLEITPISSIEYARHPDRCVILPDISIASDGRVGSIFLFSRGPVTELDGRHVALPDTSATSVVLLKVLFHHYYHVEATYETMPDDLDRMLAVSDAALLIGDNAMRARLRVEEAGSPLVVTDLGQAWKDFTGDPMVFALWVIRRDFAYRDPESTRAAAGALLTAKRVGAAQTPTLVDVAHRRTGLPRPVLEDYFRIIRHELDADYRRGLLTYYDYAYKSGLIEERVRLDIWGDGLG